MEYIKRAKSCVTGNLDLEPLYNFKKFPVFMGCTESPVESDLFADMEWFIDPLSGFIQLTNLIPLEILYKEPHMDATGDTWSRYNRKLSDFILKHYTGDILEIGGGSGKLANTILKDEEKIHKYIVVEPNPLFEENERLKVVKDFFTDEIQIDESSVGTVVLSQVLEHIYEPRDFLKQIYHFLPLNGKFVFGYPNLEYMFVNKFANAINFEHSFLLTDYFLDFLLKDVGFEIDVKEMFENHSIFYSVRKVNRIHSQIPLNNKYGHYKKHFNDFIDYYRNLVSELNMKISKSKDPVFLFGGHVFSQYLLAFGLNQEKIVAVLDNSSLKQGKRLYGTSLRVESPKILKSYISPAVILKAGLYNDEIINDIHQNINSNVIFL
jgi:SAM-dependent methyltransferase